MPLTWHFVGFVWLIVLSTVLVPAVSLQCMWNPIQERREACHHQHSGYWVPPPDGPPPPPPLGLRRAAPDGGTCLRQRRIQANRRRWRRRRRRIFLSLPFMASQCPTPGFPCPHDMNSHLPHQRSFLFLFLDVILVAVACSFYFHGPMVRKNVIICSGVSSELFVLSFLLSCFDIVFLCFFYLIMMKKMILKKEHRLVWCDTVGHEVGVEKVRRFVRCMVLSYLILIYFCCWRQCVTNESCESSLSLYC